MKNVQYSIFNQTVTQGEQITLHCIPDLNTNFIIWYFTPMVTMGNNNNFKGLSMSNRNDTSMNETITETIELAVCKPNVTCKEQYHLVNLQVQSNGILTITNIQSYHSGNYQCAMLAGVKTITMNRYLIVQAPPSKPSITVNTHSTAEKLFKLSKESNNDTYIIEGEYLDLICQSEKGLPSPQIVWSFLPMENTTITSMKLEVSQDINYNIHESLQRNENTRSSMYIPTIVPYGNTSSHFRLKVSRSHDGMRIVCKAVNRIGSSISEPYVISVRLPGLPIPSIEWLWSPKSCKTAIKSKSNNLMTPIPYKSKFSEYKDQLLINLTDTFMDGLYYCLVQNDNGNTLSDPVSITVQEEPQIIEQPNIDNVLNPSFNSIHKPYLRCVAYGKPAPQINWFHDNSIILTTSTSMNSITLGTLNDIHCSWRKILTTIKCIEFDTGSYTWETTSQLIWGYNQSFNHNLYNECYSYHLMNEGSYTCQAINNFGYDYSNPVHITLKCTPETPTDIEIKEITWDKLTLSWIPGFDGGYEQTIVIEFLKVFNKDQLTPVNNLPKSVFINHVPRLPIYQQCQISGLTPNTVYTFVIYGKNYLGHGKLSKQYTITTKATIPFMNNNGGIIIDNQLKLRNNDRKLNQSLIEYNLSLQQIQANSDDPNSLKIMKTIKDHRKRSLVLQNLTQNDIVSNQSIHNEYKNHQSSIGVKFHKDHNLTYRIWICLRNQTRICHQEKLNTISNEVDMKLSTSNLTISESNYSTSSTILPITYDITTNHNHIPTVLSFQSDMPNSMKSSTIEFTPTLYEYKPTSISYYPNLINNQYNITSTCSLIPLNNSSNNTDSLLSISKCIVDTSSIIIIPANTIDFQCTN
ncbi:putative hypothetical protein [Schistosoma mansoni]|uniref:putative hypothetical protein n=1 Tax=Schistosoma mansoni TaxID=6183 RepID=UPI00022DBF98|nr:putative hypothetical protein [Schistosoma mansoni]|eukprot:XP_018651589.1 putative hypothetical protein [Schistosoma mansoni]